MGDRQLSRTILISALVVTTATVAACSSSTTGGTAPAASSLPIPPSRSGATAAAGSSSVVGAPSVASPTGPASGTTEASQTSASSPPTTLDVSAFAGTWHGHERSLTVRADGRGVLQYADGAEGPNYTITFHTSSATTSVASIVVDSYRTQFVNGYHPPALDPPAHVGQLSHLYRKLGDTIRVDLPNAANYQLVCGSHAAPSACGA